MSDRASTEKSFNVLLEKYRTEILPIVLDEYSDMGEEDQSIVSRMNNFFCGLRLLVEFADVCESSFKRFEPSYNDGIDIGSETRPELKRFHIAESETLRLMRTCSKSFARGEDEKNGVYLSFTTFLTKIKRKNNILRFKHNRFNIIFLSLVSFLDKLSSNNETVVNFIIGEDTPFATILDPNDVVLMDLIEPNEELDPIVVSILKGLATSCSALIKRKVPEHLQGGRFWDPSESLRAEMASAMKHNKLPEFVFGQLDHLISFRPNASLLANEAYIMFTFNKTASWLKALPQEDFDKYMDESRKEGKVIRSKFRKRTKEIAEERLKSQRLKKKQLDRLESERIKKAENIANEMCYYGL
ncbi:hypothetical protein LOTGIDRAFT_164081 [Lottia gigantea]|uniref:Uncharacterized protein n=1 Tax=Lottia gigantea TaxID=225164 RepID=V4BNP4_LOTGI|nr:hypothetical protein LOTGIDRAFT_164081 [Lottia gigantea]ESO90499.1 hypothetical protein LOTGIDRAFT_164081 [Lottia gigantea]